MTLSTTRAQLRSLRRRESILILFKSKTQLPWQECPMSTADPVPEAGHKVYSSLFSYSLMFCPNPAQWWSPCLRKAASKDLEPVELVDEKARSKGKSLQWFYLYRVMLINFQEISSFLLCSAACRLTLGKLPGRTLISSQRILTLGFFCGNPMNLYFIVDCFQLSADLGQRAFDQKPTELGCNIGCFAFFGWYSFQGGSAPIREETQLHRDFPTRIDQYRFVLYTTLMSYQIIIFLPGLMCHIMCFPRRAAAKKAEAAKAAPKRKGRQPKQVTTETAASAAEPAGLEGPAPSKPRGRPRKAESKAKARPKAKAKAKAEPKPKAEPRKRKNQDSIFAVSSNLSLLAISNSHNVQ